MNVEQIGMCAGQLWTALNEADALGVKQIKKMTKMKDRELYAALGWLAREGKVNVLPSDEDPKELIISLIG